MTGMCLQRAGLKAPGAQSGRGPRCRRSAAGRWSQQARDRAGAARRKPSRASCPSLYWSTSYAAGEEEERSTNSRISRTVLDDGDPLHTPATPFLVPARRPAVLARPAVMWSRNFQNLYHAIDDVSPKAKIRGGHVRLVRWFQVRQFLAQILSAPPEDQRPFRRDGPGGGGMICIGELFEERPGVDLYP